MMTIEEWLERELAKAPPLTAAQSAQIARIVLEYQDGVRHRLQRDAAVESADDRP